MSHFNNPNILNKKDKGKPTLLLHICCAPCTTHTLEQLRKDFNVTGFFYNPNIQPETELKRRLEETRRLAAIMDFTVIFLEEGQDKWSESTKGYEDEPEGGQRCSICYKLRLEKTAQYAKTKGFAWFTTTLTIGPHKRASIINEIGRCYYEMGEYQEALKYYEEAIKIDPKAEAYVHNIATIYRELGENERAIELWEKAISINPNYQMSQQYLQKYILI